MIFEYLQPYEFSPTVTFASALVLILYVRGARALRCNGNKPRGWRTAAFVCGVVLIYIVLQTYVDYLSQHMFWVHRIQHLVLHHLAPFLIMLAVPHEVMARGIPAAIRERYLKPLWRNRPAQRIYGVVQHPAVAPVLFVGLIALWLVPRVHFDAMLSIELYKLMNWSMAVDGLLFWWLVLDPAAGEGGGPGYGMRILMLGAIMFPQILIGAYISLSNHVLYDVYNVCGRAWPVRPLLDQQIGGLTTWIPASMMSVIGALIVLRRWHRHSGPGGRTAEATPAPAAGIDRS